MFKSVYQRLKILEKNHLVIGSMIELLYETLYDAAAVIGESGTCSITCCREGEHERWIEFS